MYAILLGKAGSEAEAEERLRAIWSTTMEICLEEGATIAHHHGSGLAREPYLKRERTGDHALLEKLKRTVDPEHLLNPGKLGMGGE
jgi:alkyldihydroxyacetonephosphate synthase